MKSIGKKGFTIIELMISFSLSVVVIVYLFNVVLIVKDVYVENGIKTQLLIHQASVSKNVEEVLSSGVQSISSCGNNCILMVTTDSVSHTLSFVPRGNTITFDGVMVKLIDGSKLQDLEVNNQKTDVITTTSPNLNDSILWIKIPILHSSIDGDYGINIVFPYDSSKTSVTLVAGDMCAKVNITGTTKEGVATNKDVVLTAGDIENLSETPTYQWQKSVNGVWTNIVGANSRTYTETTDNNTNYRVNYTYGACISSSNIYSVYIDKTPPVCPSFTANKNPSTWSNANIAMTITPTGDTASYVLATNNTGGAYTDVGTKVGRFTHNFTTDGKWKAKVTVKDTIGNSQICYSNNYWIDKIAPTCSNSGGSGNWTKDNVSITGTCSDNADGSGCQGNASQTYTMSTNTTTASPGTVQDNAGNTKVCAGDRTVRIDKTPPIIEARQLCDFWLPSNNKINPRVVQIRVTDTGSGLRSGSYYVDDSGCRNCNLSYGGIIQALENIARRSTNDGRFIATVYDEVGNKSDYTVTFSSRVCEESFVNYP